MTDDEYYPASGNQVSLSPCAGAGVAALAIGCTMLVAACVLMVVNVVLFRGGLQGVPIPLALLGTGIGVGSIAALGAFATVLGVRGWGAAREGESKTLGVAGTFAAAGGLVAWFVAGIDTFMILLS
jgi:hypothetical protein